MGERRRGRASPSDYASAGTVEFLLDADGNFYFMEMNTRLQVEHPVTEMVTGIDIVKGRSASPPARRCPFTQDDVALRGHAIECRINAEDPDEQFMPSARPGERCVPPGGPWVRIDSHVYQGYTVPPFYDSLLGKLIVWGRDREEAWRGHAGPSTSSSSRASRPRSPSTAACWRTRSTSPDG